MRRKFHLDADGDILVINLTSGGPAEHGGLQKGDVIVGSGGRRLSGIDNLLALLTEDAIGGVITLRVSCGMTRSASWS